MSKRPKPLSKREEEILVNTRCDDVTKVFRGGGRTKAWLIEQRRKLVAARDAVEVTPIPKQIEEDVKRRHVKRQLNTLSKKVETLLGSKAELEQRLALALELQHSKPVPIIEAKDSGRAREIVPYLLLSDTHFGERVLAGKVGGLNEYSEEIAKQSVGRWAHNVVRLVEMYRKIRTVRQVVLNILGDLGTGNIHEENLENTWCPPIREAMFAQGAVIGAIEYLLEHLDVEKLIVPTSVGNHLRITKKPHNQHEVENSLELFVYAGIAQHFNDDPRVHVILPEAYLSYVNVMGVEVAYHHGHAVSYGGGIGGLAVPLLRYVHRQNTTRRADLYVCGHFHQRLDLGKVVVNGSMIGYNAYAMKRGFEFEKPSQEMIIIDSLYGKSHSQPIWSR